MTRQGPPVSPMDRRTRKLFRASGPRARRTGQGVPSALGWFWQGRRESQTRAGANDSLVPVSRRGPVAIFLGFDPWNPKSHHSTSEYRDELQPRKKKITGIQQQQRRRPLDELPASDGNSDPLIGVKLFFFIPLPSYFPGSCFFPFSSSSSLCCYYSSDRFSLNKRRTRGPVSADPSPRLPRSRSSDFPVFFGALLGRA